MRNQKKVDLPSSNFKTKIADVLKGEGFIIDYNVENKSGKPNLTINLKYNSGNPVINTIERVSNQEEEYFLAQKAYLKLIMD